MLWPIVLPFQIACGISFCFIIGAVSMAPRMNRPRVTVATWSVLLSLLLFVPACVGIQTALDPFRFGEFRHDDFAAVGDERVQRYLAGPATSIILNKQMNGFAADFKVTKAALDVWFQQYWDKYESRVEYKRQDPKIISREQCELEFSRSNWPLPDAGKEIWKYDGPRARTGAGWTIWFVPSQGKAYQLAGYW